VECGVWSVESKDLFYVFVKKRYVLFSVGSFLCAVCYVLCIFYFILCVCVCVCVCVCTSSSNLPAVLDSRISMSTRGRFIFGTHADADSFPKSKPILRQLCVSVCIPVHVLNTHGIIHVQCILISGIDYDDLQAMRADGKVKSNTSFGIYYTLKVSIRFQVIKYFYL